MARHVSNEVGRGRGIALSLAWEAIGLTIVILESIRLLDGSGEVAIGSLTGLVGGIGILGLALWDHVTTGGRGMASAGQNRWWWVITGVIALILALVVIATIR